MENAEKPVQVTINIQALERLVSNTIMEKADYHSDYHSEDGDFFIFKAGTSWVFVNKKSGSVSYKPIGPPSSLYRVI